MLTRETQGNKSPGTDRTRTTLEAGGAVGGGGWDEGGGGGGGWGGGWGGSRWGGGVGVVGGDDKEGGWIRRLRAPPPLPPLGLGQAEEGWKRGGESRIRVRGGGGGRGGKLSQAVPIPMLLVKSMGVRERNGGIQGRVGPG